MNKAAPRVLLISPQPFFQWRGSPLRVQFNALALSELGYAVDLLVMPVGEDKSIPGVTLHRARNILGVRNLAIGPSLPKAILDLALFAKAASLARANPYAVIHAIEDAGPIGVWLAKRHRTRFIFEKHSDPASYKKGFLRNRIMAAYSRVEAFSIRRANAIIGTGPALVAQARQIAPNKPAHHIFDIPSSLVEPDPARTAAARQQMNLPTNSIVALYVGSFAVYQGMELLFAALPIAMRQDARLHAVIIGGTPAEIDAYTALFANMGLGNRFHFPGKIHPDELPHTLAAADILLSPRIAGTNTPLKLLDYLKASRPIVACDNPANRLIINEQHARLVAPHSEAFAAGILELAADPNLRKTLGNNGQHLYKQTFTYAQYKARLATVYQNILKAP